MEDYPARLEEINRRLAQLRKEMPETINGFFAMNKAANAEGALSTKVKELIAMAIAVSSRCDGCLAFHGKALVDLGVTHQEFLEMLEVAIYMGGGPSLTTAAMALRSFESFGGDKGG